MKATSLDSWLGALDLNFIDLSQSHDNCDNWVNAMSEIYTTGMTTILMALTP